MYLLNLLSSVVYKGFLEDIEETMQRTPWKEGLSVLKSGCRSNYTANIPVSTKFCYVKIMPGYRRRPGMMVLP